MKAIVYGETIWDIFPEEQVIGGAPFNFAAHLAHLGNETYLISAVGKDELGKKALAMAAHHGVKTDLIQENSYKTGSCLVTLDEKGIPSYNVLIDVAYDHITAEKATINAIQGLHADMFYFNTLIQRCEESRQSLIRILDTCEFSEIVCDINLRKDCFDRDSLALCMEKATIVKISDEEGHFLYELSLLEKGDNDLSHAVAARYPNVKLVVYTLGKDGSMVLDTASGILYKSGKPADVKVVSTVGAGDCFGATFASTYLNGGTIPEAIRAAIERSNIVVAHREAVPFIN